MVKKNISFTDIRDKNQKIISVKEIYFSCRRYNRWKKGDVFYTSPFFFALAFAEALSGAAKPCRGFYLLSPFVFAEGSAGSVGAAETSGAAGAEVAAVVAVVAAASLGASSFFFRFRLYKNCASIFF